MCAAKPVALFFPSRCVRVCLHCYLLCGGDPSWGLTKREVSAKCNKITDTDKECVVASSDGALHNLGP